MNSTLKKRFAGSLGEGQDIRPFMSLKEELLLARECVPEITIITAGGRKKKRGDILGFVRGLRLSARLIYILRTKLHDSKVDVNWGHVQDDSRRCCSPECDIIIHQGGSSERWNGDSNGSGNVMDFHFINKDSVKAIISCKSILDSFDSDFVKVVKKEFKIDNVFVFAEVVDDSKYKALKKKALKVGYKGFWALYRVTTDGAHITDPHEYLDFLKTIRKSL